MKYRNRNVWLNVGLPFCPQGKGGPCKGPADILMSKHKGRPPLKFKSHITPDIYTERVRWGVDVWSPRAATRPTNGRRIFFFFFIFYVDWCIYIVEFRGSKRGGAGCRYTNDRNHLIQPSSSSLEMDFRFRPPQQPLYALSAIRL